MTPEDICDAYAMAANAHRGQVDKVGQLYFYHVLRVAASVRELGSDYEVVGVLHDSVEDSDLTVEDVRQRFGDFIADGVDAMTHRKGEDYFDDYLPRVLANPLARRVKFADSSDNLARVSRGDLPQGWERLAQKYQHVLETITAADEQDKG